MNIFGFSGPRLHLGGFHKPRVRVQKRFRFEAMGEPATLGDIGKVVDYGPARRATLIVGLNKGKSTQNRTGACRVQPASFSPERADEILIEERARQVGRSNVGATRSMGKGWFEGKPERSVAYDIINIPNQDEPSYTKFKKNMENLAERIGDKLCQDAVIVVHDTGKSRRTKAATRE